jgi:hypothetical protein
MLLYSSTISYERDADKQTFVRGITSYVATPEVNKKWLASN